jgi:hypothetical protein
LIPPRRGENILSSAITERGKKREKEGVCNICYWHARSKTEIESHFYCVRGLGEKQR